MKKEKIVPILNGYDHENLGELIELAVRLKKSLGKLAGISSMLNDESTELLKTA